MVGGPFSSSQGGGSAIADPHPGLALRAGAAEGGRRRAWCPLGAVGGPMVSTPLFLSAAPWGFCGAGVTVVPPSAGSSCHGAARPALGAGSEAQDTQNPDLPLARGRGLEGAAEERAGASRTHCQLLQGLGLLSCGAEGDFLALSSRSLFSRWLSHVSRRNCPAAPWGWGLPRWARLRRDWVLR